MSPAASLTSALPAACRAPSGVHLRGTASAAGCEQAQQRGLRMGWGVHSFGSILFDAQAVHRLAGPRAMQAAPPQLHSTACHVQGQNCYSFI
jgi:hypothetical protein